MIYTVENSIFLSWITSQSALPDLHRILFSALKNILNNFSKVV